MNQAQKVGMAAQPAQPGRQPAAHEVLEFAQSLAGRATDVADRVDGKLNSVTLLNPPIPTAVAMDIREYPPLFNNLRDSFFSIESALNRIESTLSRVEL